jgi:hypothetical protein
MTNPIGSFPTATTTIAPSALNFNRKISIIRKVDDTLNYEVEGGAIRTVSVQELGDAISTAVSQKKTNVSYMC